MDIAKTFSETLIGYISNVRNATAFESPQQQSCSNCSSSNRILLCDSSTSTHDLSTFVWNTEGAGIEMLADVDNDRCYYFWDSPNGPNYSKRKTVHIDGNPNPTASKQQKQNNRVPLCDASTSSFDLNAFIWCVRGYMVGEDGGLIFHERDCGGFAAANNLVSSIELSHHFGGAIGKASTVPVDTVAQPPPDWQAGRELLRSVMEI